MSVESAMRRIQLMFSTGRVRASTEKGHIQTVQAQLNDMETIDNLASIGHYGLASRPQADADAVIIFLGGDRSKGVIIGTSDQRYHFQVAGGEVALHDDLGQSIHLTRSGIAIDGGGLQINISNTPLVHIDSAIRATGTITSEVDVIALPGNVSLKNHRNTGVKAGGDTSGPPAAG